MSKRRGLSSFQSSNPSESDAIITSSSNSTTTPNNNVIIIEVLPCEVLGRVESYLGASDCAQWSGTCVALQQRWTGQRWQQTYRLQYSSTSTSSSTSSSSSSSTRIPSMPSIVSFVEDEFEPSSETTQFNMSSLLPSIYKVYSYLWDTIELAMLGYYGTVDSYSASGMISAGMDYVLFLITLNPLLSWKSLWNAKSNTNTNTTTTTNNNNSSNDNHKFLLRIPYSISPWKLACILKERGVPCIQCRLCNQIDVLGGTATSSTPRAATTSTSTTWIRPCLCPDLVHRECLERHIGLAVDTLHWRTHDRRWITYDETQAPIFSVAGIAAVNDHNEFTHNPKAFCHHCGTTYSRSVRLPYNAKEVLLVSLVDPLSLLRAFSTFIHFLLACFLVSAVEALSDPSDQSVVLCNLSPYLLLKWPRTNSWASWALAWWQLQRCCLLHIFFSPRFAAVVDR
jgi:hypothetical protein